jgi:hypothetical protein
MNTEQILKRLIAPQDRPAGMYLRLYHGRPSPKHEMDGWGPDGPVFGPLKYCHITYMSTINICGMDDEDTGPMSGDDPIHFVDDLIFYDGWYYGDWAFEYEDKK